MVSAMCENGTYFGTLQTVPVKLTKGKRNKIIYSRCHEIFSIL